MRLLAFVAELEDELEPVDETEVDRYAAMFGTSYAAAAASEETL